MVKTLLFRLFIRGKSLHAQKEKEEFRLPGAKSGHGPFRRISFTVEKKLISFPGGGVSAAGLRPEFPSSASESPRDHLLLTLNVRNSAAHLKPSHFRLDEIE